MDQKFDLLGDPIPENRGQPGATGHIPTAENVNKVRLLLIAGMKKPAIARQLGISIPTLNKHYFKKLSIRNAQLAALGEERARMLMLLDKEARAGSVPAMKEIGKIVKEAEMECLAGDIRRPTAKPKPLGIKAQRKIDAKPEGTWEFLPNTAASERIN